MPDTTEAGTPADESTHSNHRTTRGYDTPKGDAELAGQVPFSPHEISNGALEPESGPETPDTVQKARREAARYRTELRVAESERDALRGRLETLQKAQVEELAMSTQLLGFFTFRDGRDLWLAGVQLSGLLDDEGRTRRR